MRERPRRSERRRVWVPMNSASSILRKEAMAEISFSETLTSPGQRQQLVQRWQRYLGGFFLVTGFSRESRLRMERKLERFL